MKGLLTIVISVLFVLSGCNQNTDYTNQLEEEMSQNDNNDENTKAPLSNLLEEKKKSFLSKADSAKITAYEKGIQDVKNTGILDKALNVGSKAKDFTLSNAKGDTVNLYQLLENGPVILTWYRGGWCPYCNLTLRYLQEEIPRFEKYGAQLVALSPEVPDQSLNTQEKNNLEFEVLSDVDNKVGINYGVVYDLPIEIAKRYESGFGLSNYNGNNKAQLPLSATYVINSDGTIEYAYLNADYRERAEPSELLDILSKLK